MSKIAVVTGAGSGVGRAIVLKLAAHGWSAALVGRRAEPLDQTIALAGPVAGKLLPIPCDVSDEPAVAGMAQRIRQELGEVDVLVNAAGTNTPRRSLDQLSIEDYRKVLSANLTGAFLCVQAFLPEMRRRGAGTIVNIISDAGLIANAKAGAAYVASKFGLTGLSQSINAEERQHGIRCCAIFPGDIDTPLLEKRPTLPTLEAREKMLRAEDVADCAMLAINLPLRAIVEQLVVRPR